MLSQELYYQPIANLHMPIDCEAYFKSLGLNTLGLLVEALNNQPYTYNQAFVLEARFAITTTYGYGLLD